MQMPESDGLLPMDLDSSTQFWDAQIFVISSSSPIVQMNGGLTMGSTLKPCTVTSARGS